MLRIAFVIPKTPDGNFVPSLGLLTMAAVLERDGHEIVILDQHLHEDIIQKIKMFEPDLLGISAVTSAVLSGNKIASIIKKEMQEVTVVFGGPHPSTMPDEVIAWPFVDFVIIREGERSIQMLAQWLDDKGQPQQLAEIPNLYYKSENGIQTTFNAPFLSSKDLETLPLPAYHLIDPHTASKKIRHGLFRKGKRVLPYMATRGCPQRCTFCCRMMGKQVRKKSPEKVLSDFEYLIQKYDINEIYLEDDNFTASKTYALKILNGMIERKLPINLKFANGLRIDTLSEDLLEKMKQAGCHFVGFGLESASPKVLNLMKKDLDLDLVRRRVDLIKSFGFLVGANMIIGYPGETEQDIWESYDFFKSLRLDSVAVVNLIPFPGTTVRRLCEENGYLTPLANSWDNYYFDIKDPKILIETEWMSQDRLKKLIKKIFFKFYTDKKRVVTLLKNMSISDFTDSIKMVIQRVMH